MLRRRTLLLAGVLPVLGACAASPRHELGALRPPEPLPATAWESLGHPSLVALVQRAWQYHPDVEVALATARQARAQAAQMQASRRPLVQATGSHSRSQQGGAYASSAGLNIEAQWDLDLGGGTALAARGQALRAESQGLMVHAARASLACQVAGAFLSAVVEQHRYGWAREYRDMAARRTALLELQVRAGTVRRMELTSAHADEALILRAERRIAGEFEEALAQLTALTGASRPELAAYVDAAASAGLPGFQVTTAVSSAALLQRPDVMAADLECLAVSAELAAAERARFPRVNLGAVLGLAAAGLGGLTSAGATVAALSQALKWDVFDGGRAQAAVDYAKASEQLAAARYRQRSLSVLSESAVSMARYRLALDEMAAAQIAVTRSVEALGAAQLLFSSGVADKGVVLDAERALLDVKAQALESAQLVVGAMTRVLHAAAGPMEGLALQFLPLSRPVA